MKKFFNYLLVWLLKAIIAVVCIIAFVYWVGACIGSVFDIDGNPSPGLHWKP